MPFFPLKMFNSFCARHGRRGENMAVKKRGCTQCYYNVMMIFDRGLKDVRTNLSGWEGGLHLT